MKLPNASAAFVDLAKLRHYCLSTNHPEGKHKARVFAAALGLDSEDAEWLRGKLLAAAGREECQPGRPSNYRRRYTLSFDLEKDGLSARIRSGWIIRAGENFPRLVSCYVV